MMKKAFLAYLAAILVIGAIVALVMTRETETEKAEAEEKAQEAEREPRPLPGAITPGEEIAQRVARIRGLEFEGGAPEVEVVPEAELDEQIARLDEQPPEDEALARAAALVLAQAGALPAGEAEALVNRRYGGKGALGAYLPEERKVLVSREFAEDEPEIAELVAASELSRALDVGPAKEDVRVAPPFADDEAALATLRAGAAAQVEREYAAKHLNLRESPGESEVRISREARDDPATPPMLQVLAAFPPEIGALFVAGVFERGGWDAVDELLGEPPATTAELLHPDVEPQPAPDFEVEQALGEGWRSLGGADVGELDTIALLRAGLRAEGAARAAAGWRAGRFETWTRGEEECAPPCRRDSASVMVWRFANPVASLRFVRAMRRAVLEGTQAQPEGGRGFVIDGAGAALIRAGRFAALTFAPDAPQAGELATAALEG